MLGVLPFTLDLIGARAEVVATAEDCSGTSPNCCVDPAGLAQTLLGLFDEDADCAVGFTELQQSSLISSLLAPDLDLLDADGQFDPSGDGEKDLLSVGVGWSAVGASFPLPEPARHVSAAAVLLVVAALRRRSRRR